MTREAETESETWRGLLLGSLLGFLLWAELAFVIYLVGWEWRW